MIIILFTLFITIQSATVKFETCDRNKIVEIKNIKSTPWPPITGLKSFFEFDISTLRQIDYLYANITSFSKTSLFQWNHHENKIINLCDEYIYCPMIIGDLKVKIPYLISHNIISGSKWKVRIELYEKEQKSIISCVDLETFEVK